MCRKGKGGWTRDERVGLFAPPILDEAHVETQQIDGGTPSSERLEEPGLLLGSGAPPPTAPIRADEPGTNVTPSTSATTQSPRDTSTPPTRTGEPTEPGLSLVAPVNRDRGGEYGEPVGLEC